MQRIPGVLVATVKPKTGALKARIVAAGNYLSKEKKIGSPTLNRKDLFASGLDVYSLRLLLAFGAAKGLEVACTDVKTAFLRAPLRDREGKPKIPKPLEMFGEGEEVILVRPPKALVRAGLVSETDWLLVQKALYGLDVSPSLWGTERDERLTEVTWDVEGSKRWLVQCKS